MTKQPPINTLIPRVEAYLDKLFITKIKQAGDVDSYYVDILKELRTLVGRGGKRLRPNLTLIAYEGFGGTNLEAAIKAAASQELFHAFMLIHDDIVDRDLTRWGGPNIAGRYLEKFKKMDLTPEDRAHFSNAWALLAGDICFGISLESLLMSGFDSELVVRATTLMQHTLFDVVGGEVLDTALSIFKDTPTEQQLLNVCHYKTASYSFIAPLQIGALFAGANESALARIKYFGQALGIAYQLKDDLLGMFGDEEILGKPVLTDLREGKRTLLIANALRLSTRDQAITLQQKLGDPAVTKRDLKRVQDILANSGAKLATEEMAQKYQEEALQQLPEIGFSAEACAVLAHLASFSLTRNT